jgi:hypothetical protein
MPLAIWRPAWACHSTQRLQRNFKAGKSRGIDCKVGAPVHAPATRNPHRFHLGDLISEALSKRLWVATMQMYDAADSDQWHSVMARFLMMIRLPRSEMADIAANRSDAHG